MSINFATLQGLTIPEGVVTQIADASGRILWSAGGSVVLQVKKKVLTTYAGETEYPNEEFILFDIYPKTNGTVKVTYGGLTKTITDTSGAESPNSQQVFFGTFNGVSDSVTTPASGELTIEGDLNRFSTGSYQSGSKALQASYCGCITDVVDWGIFKNVPSGAFRKCTELKQITFPKGIKSIGSNAFEGCTNLALSSLPDSITRIEAYAFQGCSNITLSSLPSGITRIESYAFYGCNNITLSYLPSGVNYISSYAFYGCRNLKLTSIPEGVTSIMEYAFYMTGCDSYKDILDLGMYGITITLPSTLTTIGTEAFCTDYCYNDMEYWYYGYIKTVKCLSTTPPTKIGDSTFGDGCFNGTETTGNSYAIDLIVPKGCYDAYSGAGFSHVFIKEES